MDDSILSQINSEYQISSINVCPDFQNRNVFGIQLEYGRWDEDGVVTDTTVLPSHGYTESTVVVDC